MSLENCFCNNICSNCDRFRGCKHQHLSFDDFLSTIDCVDCLSKTLHFIPKDNKIPIATIYHSIGFIEDERKSMVLLSENLSDFRNNITSQKGMDMITLLVDIISDYSPSNKEMLEKLKIGCHYSNSDRLKIINVCNGIVLRNLKWTKECLINNINSEKLFISDMVSLSKRTNKTKSVRK
jgi:hypothetical protein